MSLHSDLSFRSCILIFTVYATFSVSTKLHCLRVGPLHYIVKIDFVLLCKVPEELIRMQKMMIMTAAWVATCNGYRRGIVEMKIDIFCYCCCWRIFLASQRVANELWVLCQLSGALGMVQQRVGIRKLIKVLHCLVILLEIIQLTTL